MPQYIVRTPRNMTNAEGDALGAAGIPYSAGRYGYNEYEPLSQVGPFAADTADAARARISDILELNSDEAAALTVREYGSTSD